MTIVWVNNRPYIPVHNGFKEITQAQACEMYEKGEVTGEETINHD